MPNDVNPLNTDDEGLNLWELLDVVKSGWHWLAGGAALGLVGAVGFVMLVPAKYEAVAIVQSAKVIGRSGKIDFKPLPVEFGADVTDILGTG